MIKYEHRWSVFQEKVRTIIEPLLVQMGFQCKKSGAITEESTPDGHPFFSYARSKDGMRINIDVLQQHKFEHGQLSYFDWIRVEIDRDYLRHLFPPPATTTNIYEIDGWIYIDEAGLGTSIEEIVKLLKIFFNLSV